MEFNWSEAKHFLERYQITVKSQSITFSSGNVQCTPLSRIVFNKQTYCLARDSLNVCGTITVKLVDTINTYSSIQTRVAGTFVDI